MKYWYAVLLLWVAPAGADAQDLVHLRNRTIARPAAGARTPMPGGGHHFIVQFGSYPDAQVREELKRRHIRVLNYVPDSALMVASAGTPDVRGLNVVWLGQLDASDKLSPEVARGVAGPYLVILHADVAESAGRELAAAEGFDVLENPYLLPGQLLMAGNGSVDGLAKSDSVAYILTASADLVSRAPVMGCGGPITEAGPVGEYVEVGRGWSRDSAGNVALQYVYQSLTEKLDAAGVKSEIERAMREWQKYANITFAPGGRADAARTIAIQFARGSHGDGYPFDGLGGTLAHTFYPAPPNTEPLAGDMHLDADETWHIGTTTDVFSVVLHELGHALGLGHSTTPGTVMYPYYRFSSGLTDDDIAGIRDLYGAAQAGNPTQPPTSTPPTTQPPVNPPSNPPVTDVTPPSIRLTSPASTIVSMAAPTIHIMGTATDYVGVTSVKWSTSNGDTGVAAGTANWSADVPLLVGNTIVTVRAYDAGGNSGWRSLTVIRH